MLEMSYHFTNCVSFSCGFISTLNRIREIRQIKAKKKTDKNEDSNVSMWHPGHSVVILHCAKDHIVCSWMEEYGSKIGLLQPLYLTHTTACRGFY